MYDLIHFDVCSDFVHWTIEHFQVVLSKLNKGGKMIVPTGRTTKPVHITLPDYCTFAECSKIVLDRVEKTAWADPCLTNPTYFIICSCENSLVRADDTITCLPIPSIQVDCNGEWEYRPFVDDINSAIHKCNHALGYWFTMHCEHLLVPMMEEICDAIRFQKIRQIYPNCELIQTVTLPMSYRPPFETYIVWPMSQIVLTVD
jgi:hypothetical protein